MNSTSILDWVQLIAQNAWLYGGAFLLVLGILVFVHEWGHYIVARMCGVNVESFSIGFGPEILGFDDKHGTRWKISVVPLGGYVKMFGDVDPASAHHSEEVEDKKTKQKRKLSEKEKLKAFFAKPVWQRAAIVFAGPAINFIFAIILLSGLYMTYGQPVTPPVAAAVIGGSAAEEAGFEPHDEIIAIDGEKVRRFEDVKRAVLIGLDTEQRFTINRQGKTIDIFAKPHVEEVEDHFGFKHSYGVLGIVSPGNGIHLNYITAVNGQSFENHDDLRAYLLENMGQKIILTLDRGEQTDTFAIQPFLNNNTALQEKDSEDFNHLTLAAAENEVLVSFGPVEAVIESVLETKQIIVSTLEALGQMVTGTRSASELGGIIRIGAIAGDMAKSGFVALVSFTALLSINLGLINLFPIPMLDGGHLVFYAVESVKGSPLSEEVQEYAFRLGLMLLIGVMIFANLNDIMQLIL